jgi:geranylgeranyl transferase type-2 subunit beta
MSPSPYLDMLDKMFRKNLVGLSADFVDSQVGFVCGCQQSDGGFSGRQGGSDLYYTDFALRCLALLAPEHAAFGRAADYINHHAQAPRNIVECFSFLNVHRILNLNSAGDAKHDPVIDLPTLKDLLQKHRLPQGGFARSDGNQSVSAYQTFLGALCFQMLGENMPAINETIRAIESLKRPDGGYAEFDGQAASQTSATAAAVAFLLMHDAIVPEKINDTAEYLAHMQSADGGLKVHIAVENGDLLSTFTGLVTLSALDQLNSIDTARAAQFLRGTAHPNGGFMACTGDDSPDVEYTYYGIGALALLRALQQY